MNRGSQLGALSLGLALILPAVGSADADRERSQSGYRVLVFTKTANGEHGATAAGVAAIRELAARHNFRVSVTDDAGEFTGSGLDRYRAVVFLNTAGDVLDDAQRTAFERYLAGGGGLVAIHAAIDAEPDWQFMTDALGARASGVSSVQRATVKVADRVHPSSRPLPEYWTPTDRWLNFTRNVRGFLHVLATVDETTYAGGAMGFDHPIAWCQDFHGGRVWYTGRGGVAQAYAASAMRDHLLGGIEWAAGRRSGDCGATVLANFRMTVLARNQVLNGTPEQGNYVGEPIGFDVLPDGRVIQTTRGTGSLPGQPLNIQKAQLWLHAADGSSHTILAELLVYNNSEDGLYGPAIDKEFADNKWVYLYYAPAIMEPPFPRETPAGSAPTFGATPDVWDPWLGYFQLSRFKFVETPTPHLDLASEQKILKVPVNRGACCHVAGDIAFDSKNNLWLVTGDDTPAGGGNSGGFAPFNDGPTNVMQSVTIANATGGTFTLTFDGQTTAPIPFTSANAAANNAAVAAALNALTNLEGVVVTGNAANVRTVAFPTMDAPQMTASAAGLTGAGATVTVAITQPGGLLNAPHVDARRSALNTNDLRGKILRIKVNADGSYSIPEGNLFDERNDRAGKTRPEIYAMGFRNPFRINLDKNDVAYITDYSPDSRVPQVFRGPAGTGRVMIVREPANYGWPLCYAPDLPYYRWNFVSSQPLDDPPQPFECDHKQRGPENASRWNTGLAYSPPVSRPDIWYSFNDNNAPTPPLPAPLGTPCFDYYNGPLDPETGLDTTPTCPQRFPELGPGGGVGPHGAAPYNFDRNLQSPTKFPEYYDGAFIFGEFTRDYLREVRLDAHGRIFKINNVLNCSGVTVPPLPPTVPTPERPFDCDNPMDSKWGPDGNFYLLTYGDGFFSANPDAQLVRFSYVKNVAP